MLNQVLNYIFMIFGMFVPLFIYFITLGHVVYSVGEYQEQNERIPKILVITIFKIILIGIVLVSIYSWHFKYDHLSLSMLLWGIIITFDSKYVNNMLACIDNYRGKHFEFKNFVIENMRKKISIRNNTSWFLKFKLYSYVLLSLVIFWYYTNNIQIILRDICLPVYIYYDLLIWNYYKSFVNNKI